MAVVTVSAIRNEIWRAAGAQAADGAGAEAGRLFHRIVAEALGDASAASWARFFSPERLREDAAAESYSRALYEEVLGPALAARPAVFEERRRRCSGSGKG